MWFDGIRQPNTLYVANTSRGKDSTAMLRAIEIMGWPLDMICAVDIWATQDIPAELPPMVAFKDDYDRKVFDWFGVPVTRLCATKRERERTAPECHTPTCFTLNWAEANSLAQSKDSPWSEAHGANILKPAKLTYEDIFYRKRKPKRERERETRAEHLRIPVCQGKLVQLRPQESGIYGWPTPASRWCTGELKRGILQASLGRKAHGVRTGSRATVSTEFSELPQNEGQKINIVHYIGIAADEPARIAKHMPKKDKVLPLVQIGWDEDLCGLEVTYMDMLSPTYEGSTRDDA